MNIFILAACVKACAESMVDKHISKIILECAQMLCTAKHVLHPEGIDVSKIYKIAHKNHPCTIWVRSSIENYMWTISLVEAMHNEWKYRYNHPEDKLHKSYIVVQYLKENPPPLDSFPNKGLTKFAMAMPDEFKREDPIEAYRLYYQSEPKRKLASWKKRGKPEWYKV